MKISRNYTSGDFCGKRLTMGSRELSNDNSTINVWVCALTTVGARYMLIVSIHLKFPYDLWGLSPIDDGTKKP